MIVIFIIWIGVSIAALLPLVLAVWRIRRYTSQVALRFVQVSLTGAIIHNLIAAYLSISGLVASRTLDQPASFSAIMLTIAHLAQTLPVIVFSLYLLGLFSAAPGDPEAGLT